jgi:peptide/nickel transport system substrate-binding protein
MNMLIPVRFIGQLRTHVTLAVALAVLVGCAPVPSAGTPSQSGPKPTVASAPTTTGAGPNATTAAPQPTPAAASGSRWSDKTFVKVYISLPDNIDPHGKLYDSNAEPVIRTFYESLIDYNPKTQKLEGVLATSWEISPDAQMVTFHLRDGVKFHDGSQLTSEAVKLSLERIVDQGSARAQLLRDMDSVEAVDPLSVRVHLKTSNPIFVTNVPELPIASADALKAHAKDQWFLTQEAGSGAYMLQGAFQPGATSVRFQPFGDYWRGWGQQGFVTTLPAGAKHLGAIETRVVPESATQRLLMESGEAHFMTRTPIAYLTDLKDSSTVKPVTMEAYRISLLPLNVAHGPLTDIRLRRMLQYAFPYNAYLQDYYQGHATQAAGFVNPKLMDDPTLKPIDQDLDQARALLKEAGYTPGQLSLTYVWPTGGEEQQQPGILLQDALRQIGVELKVDSMPFANIVQRVASGAENAPDVMTLINTPKGIDPGVGMLQTFFYSANAGNPYNWGYYKNPAFDKLMEDGQHSLDEAQRLEDYRQAQRLVIQDVASIYLGFPNRWALLSKNVDGYWLSPISLDRDPWYDMYWTN